MRNLLLLSLALLAPRAYAAGFEDAARLGAEAAAKARFMAARVEAHARILKGETRSTDLSMMFELGSAPKPEDLAGWHSGRRFNEKGAGAQLLVGGEFYEDPNSGPIGGKAFKALLFPYVGGVKPADLYDEPASHLVDTVQSLIRDNAKGTTALAFTASGAVWKKGAESFELRKWGRYLVCKYPGGDYGYFFKKVSPAAGASAGLKAAGAPSPVLPVPGSDQLSALFDSGTPPSDSSLTGWFAGRRFVPGGPVAGLLVGVELYDDAEAGPIDGSTFKVVLFGPDKPGIVPVDLYDIAGSGMLNGVSWNLRARAPNWTTTRADSGVMTSFGGQAYEVRQAGDFFVVRYPNGYGYFFKKIR